MIVLSDCRTAEHDTASSYRELGNAQAVGEPMSNRKIDHQRSRLLITIASRPSESQAR